MIKMTGRTWPVIRQSWKSTVGNPKYAKVIKSFQGWTALIQIGQTSKGRRKRLGIDDKMSKRGKHGK